VDSLKKSSNTAIAKDVQRKTGSSCFLFQQELKCPPCFIAMPVTRMEEVKPIFAVFSLWLIIYIFIIIVISDSTVLVRTLAATHSRFRNVIKTLGLTLMTPLDEWSAHRKGLYLRRTTQHRNTKTNIHASSGIRTQDPSNQAAKTYVNLHCRNLNLEQWSVYRDVRTS
jgi:hypothetical protein